MAVEQIVSEYPALEPEDIRQALRYASWTTEDIVHVPTKVT